MSSVAVDQALEALAEAFARRNGIADRLFKLAPGVARDASLRLIGDGAATRAARRVDLHQYMKLAWSGRADHNVALASAFPVPESADLVARLRGGPAADREAA